MKQASLKRRIIKKREEKENLFRKSFKGLAPGANVIKQYRGKLPW